MSEPAINLESRVALLEERMAALESVPPGDADLMSAAQIAALWDCKTSTVRGWLSRGDSRIPPPLIQRPRLTRWSRAEVLQYRNRWIDAQRLSGGPR